MYEEQFLDLMRCFVPTIEQQSRIGKSRQELGEVCAKFRSELGQDAAVFSEGNRNQFVGPCPIAWTGARFKLVWMGLNPAANESAELSITWENTWQEWAEHHSISNSTNNSFKVVAKNDLSNSFYRTVFWAHQVLVESKDYSGWSSIRSDYQSKGELERAFLNKITHNPICAAELIPFASSGINASRAARIFSEGSYPAWNNYLEKVIPFLFENTEQDGWMVFFGNPAHQTFDRVRLNLPYSREFRQGPHIKIENGAKYSHFYFHHWGDKRVIYSPFYGGAATMSESTMRNMFSAALQYFDHKSIDVPGVTTVDF